MDIKNTHCKIEFMKSIAENRTTDEHGYPIPRSEKCLECNKEIWLVYSFARKDYSLKNSWFYYTEREEDQGKYKCSPCLRNFYLNQRSKFLEVIKSPKKRNHLRTYISHSLI